MKRKASNSQAPWRNRITGYGEESPEKLLANPFNFRVHPDEQQAALSGALRQVGIVQNVLVNRTTGHVLDGHMRAALAIQERQPTVPVTYVEMSEAEERIVLASFDKISSMAEIDQAMLDQLIGEIRLGDVELNPDVDALIQSMLTPEEETTGGGNTDEDEVPEAPAEPVTRLGDLWLLGRHRVLCGDSTQIRDVERLMDGEKADMVFTDPPYGIEVVRGGSIGKNGFDGVVKAGEYRPIIGDDSIESALEAYALFEALNVKTILLWGGNFYAHRLPPARCWVVWDKQTDGNFGDGELAWCNADKSIRIFRHKWSGMLKASEHGQKRVHPTQKPIALAEWAFSEFIPSGRLVLDGFLGSGSTLIACEKTGRACYGMELSPDYCDVIVHRWQDFTGKQATLDGDGRTFAQVQAERAAQEVAA